MGDVAAPHRPGVVPPPPTATAQPMQAVASIPPSTRDHVLACAREFFAAEEDYEEIQSDLELYRDEGRPVSRVPSENIRLAAADRRLNSAANALNDALMQVRHLPMPAPQWDHHHIGTIPAPGGGDYRIGLVNDTPHPGVVIEVVKNQAGKDIEALYHRTHPHHQAAVRVAEWLAAGLDSGLVTEKSLRDSIIARPTVPPDQEHHLEMREVLAPDEQVYVVRRTPNTAEGRHIVTVAQPQDPSALQLPLLYREECTSYDAAVALVQSLVERIERGEYPSADRPAQSNE